MSGTAEEETIEVDLKGLDKLIQSLKGPLPFIRIGILGSNARKGSSKGLTNAEVGAAHEYGTSVMPMRSWLRMPLIEHLSKYLEKSGLFTEDLMKLFIKAGDLKPILAKVAVVAEGVIADAFASGGFGAWAPWKSGYENNTGNILVDTQQLRNSVTSGVKE